MSLLMTHRGLNAFINCISDVSDKIDINEIEKIMKKDILNGSINYYVAIIHNIKKNNIKMLRQLNKKHKLNSFKNILLETAIKYNIDGSHNDIIQYLYKTKQVI